MAKAIEPGSTYRVKLNRPVTYGRAELRTILEHEMTGRVLLALIEKEGADAILSHVKIGGG